MNDFNREQIEQRQQAREKTVAWQLNGIEGPWGVTASVGGARVDREGGREHIAYVSNHMSGARHEHVADFIASAPSLLKEAEADLTAALTEVQRLSTLCDVSARIGNKAIDRLQVENERLRDWQATVTAAIQHEGGSFFEDVPKHIRELRAQLTACQQERDDLRDGFAINAALMTDAREKAERAEQALQRVRNVLVATNVPPTIATDEKFRDIYCQAYRHALADVSTALAAFPTGAGETR